MPTCYCFFSDHAYIYIHTIVSIIHWSLYFLSHYLPLSSIRCRVGMAPPTILRLNFIKVLEEVASGLQLEPPVFSVAANIEGTGSKATVNLQLRARDPGSFSSFNCNAECPQEALQFAAYMALQQLMRSNNAAFIDVNFLAHWKQRNREAKRELEHQQAITQLH